MFTLHGLVVFFLPVLFLFALFTLFVSGYGTIGLIKQLRLSNKDIDWSEIRIAIEMLLALPFAIFSFFFLYLILNIERTEMQKQVFVFEVCLSSVMWISILIFYKILERQKFELRRK